MLKRSFGYRWIITALVISFALARTQAGFGASFEVSPIRVSLLPNESSTLLTVRNEGEERLRLQISVMAWDQSKGGEMVLKLTDDIIFYPSLLTVDPGGQRNLRVGTNGAVVAKEQTYRIFVAELPSNQKLQGAGLRIVTKMSIPIFIKPAKTEVKNSIDRIELRGSELTFDVKNHGNVHIQPRELRIKGTGADGRIALERKIPGWYILAGGMREYRVEVPKAECDKVKDVTVEVDLEAKSLKENYTVPFGACAR